MKWRRRRNDGRGESNTSSGTVIGAERGKNIRQRGWAARAPIGARATVMLIDEGKKRDWNTSGDSKAIAVVPRVGVAGNGV